jgi:hypothetical protein
MRWYYTLPLRIRSVFRKQEVEQGLREEILFHLQYQVEEYVARGMDPEEARFAALRSLGGLEQVKQECRDMRSVNFVENLVQDLRFGFRMLWRNPGFSALAILCLALGIGANAAVFSWIEGISLRPFPLVAHQERLVAVVATESSGSKAGGGPTTTASHGRIGLISRRAVPCSTHLLRIPSWEPLSASASGLSSWPAVLSPLITLTHLGSGPCLVADSSLKKTGGATVIQSP